VVLPVAETINASEDSLQFIPLNNKTMMDAIQPNAMEENARLNPCPKIAHITL